MEPMRKLFKHSTNVIGMIHVLPLPGSPKFGGNIESIVTKAKEEAEIYAQCNIGGVIVENMHDIPYLHPKDLGPETVAAMTRLCREIRQVLPQNIPCGVQVLAAGNREAIAIAQAAELNFIRAEGFVFGHVADEGYMDACAGPLLRYRSNIKAEDVLIFADIKKKHSSHAITNDLSIVDVAKAAEFFSSDGVIITGTATGEEASVKELLEVKRSVKIPVLIGSGVTLANLEEYLSADALIIGSYFKKDGRWENAVDKERVKAFMDKMNAIRNSG